MNELMSELLDADEDADDNISSSQVALSFAPFRKIALKRIEDFEHNCLVDFDRYQVLRQQLTDQPAGASEKALHFELHSTWFKAAQLFAEIDSMLFNQLYLPSLVPRALFPLAETDSEENDDGAERGFGIFDEVLSSQSAVPFFRWQKTPFQGYCPVDLVEKCHLIEGKPKLAISYKSQVVIACSKPCFDRIMAQPEDYFNLKTTIKSPCRIAVAYLEEFRSSLNPERLVELNKIVDRSIEIIRDEYEAIQVGF